MLSACEGDADRQDVTAGGGLTAATAAGSEPGTIESVEYEGDGCPPGTAVTSLSGDGRTFFSIFSQFMAQAGANVPREAASRRCLLHVTVDVPEGWSYTLSGVRYLGFVSLEAAVTAERHSRYRLEGNGARKTEVSWEGPATESYNQGDIGPGNPLGFTHCGRGQDLRIDAEVGLDSKHAPERNALLTIDEIVVQSSWTPCD